MYRIPALILWFIAAVLMAPALLGARVLELAEMFWEKADKVRDERARRRASHT